MSTSCPRILPVALGLALAMASLTASAADNPLIVQWNQRLAALQADPALADVAEMPPRAAASEAARARRATVFMTKTP